MGKKADNSFEVVAVSALKGKGMDAVISAPVSYTHLADIMENPEMLDALIGVYERNVLGYPSTAVLPYSQALIRFPAHLQQADMESVSYTHLFRCCRRFEGCGDKI